MEGIIAKPSARLSCYDLDAILELYREFGDKEWVASEIKTDRAKIIGRLQSLRDNKFIRKLHKRTPGDDRWVWKITDEGKKLAVNLQKLSVQV